MPMNPRLLRPLASGFNPRHIAGLELWLDGSDQTSMTLSGTSVSEWRDKSGADNHAAQTTANNRPTLTASGLNSKSVLTFAGSPVEMTTSLTLAAPYSLIAVVKEDARHIGAYVGPSTFSNLGFGDVFTQSVDYNDGRWSAWGGGREVYGNANASVTQSATILSNIISGTSFPSDISVFANGSGGVVSATFGSVPPGSGIDNLRIGRRGATTEYWIGFIAELLVYTRAVTTAERQRIERGLSAKWGVAVS